MPQLTKPDLIVIIIRFLFKTFALYVLFQFNFSTTQVIIAGATIIATEIYEIPALILALRYNQKRSLIYSILGPINMLVTIGLLTYLDLLESQFYLYPLAVTIGSATPGGLLPGIVSGITGGILYVLINLGSSTLGIETVMFRGFLFIAFGSTFGALSEMYFTSKRRHEHLVEEQTHEKESEALKSEFTSMASHNLRSPIAVIKGYLQIMQEEEPDSEEYNSAFERVKQQVDAFNKQVEDLIETTEIASDRMQFDFKIQPLEPLLDKVVAKYETIAKDRGLRLEYSYHIDESVQVKYDIQRMLAAVENIVDNAIKYNTKGHFIKLIAEPDKENPDMVCISIIDDGGGIPEEVIGNLFTKFTRAKEHKETGGSGIGLYLTRHIIEAHNGSINAENHNNEAHFKIRLPVSKKAN